MTLAEEIHQILTEKPSRWVTVEQLEAIDAAYKKSPEYVADQAEEAQLNEPFEIAPPTTVTTAQQLADYLNPPFVFMRPGTRPVYPIHVWDDTVVGEFAKLCGRDNNVPRKLYAEAFRTVLGAVLGDRLIGPKDGVIPRAYTIIIAPKGRGKGTSVRRAVEFFSKTWNSAMTSLEPGLLFHARNCQWKSQGIGAFNASASSAPGMAKLTSEDQKVKGLSPHQTWNNTIPRILSVHEELKTFLSSLFIEGGTGKALDGVICSLWDGIDFASPATDKRPPAYGQMQFSLLGAVTPEDWFDLLSRSDAVGGGLMSRLNLIGTDGEYELVDSLDEPNFKALQDSFLPRVRQLADAPCSIGVTDEGKEVMRLFTKHLPPGNERMNVHAWRSALLLAWLHHEPAINKKMAAGGCMLAMYQVQMHEFYRTAKMDNPLASIQDKIVRCLTMKGPQKKKVIWNVTHGSRSGTELWNRAFDGLIRGGAVGQLSDGRFAVCQ
jgi:Protein of unknown function (DUF3987)